MINHAIRSSGRALSAQTRGLMEPRFGHDFSQVRIHTGAEAHQSAEALAARAYTVGRDIVFREGLFAPDSAEGQRLLAHELTHVVQQRGTTAAADALQADLSVSQPGDPAEREAEAVAEQVTARRRIGVRRAPTAAVARDGDEDAPQSRRGAPVAFPGDADPLPDSRDPASNFDPSQLPQSPSLVGEAAEYVSQFYSGSKSGSYGDGNWGVQVGSSERGAATDDHPGEKLDVGSLPFLQAGKFGEEGKKRYGLHASAGAAKYDAPGGPLGGDAQAGTLSADANIGEDGFSLGYGATAVGLAGRGGDLSKANGEEARFGLSAGPSFGARGYWGKQADGQGKAEDGHRVYGLGADLGPFSFDLKTKDPVGTLANHAGFFSSDPLSKGADGGTSVASLLGFGPKDDPNKETNKTDSLLKMAGQIPSELKALARGQEDEPKILKDPSLLPAGPDAN